MIRNVITAILTQHFRRLRRCIAASGTRPWRHGGLHAPRAGVASTSPCFHDKIRVGSAFAANAMIGHDERRARCQQFSNARNRIRRHFDAIESRVGFLRRRLRWGRLHHVFDCRFGPPGRALGRARRVLWNRHDGPAKSRIPKPRPHQGKHMRSQRLLRIPDRDRSLEQVLEAMTHEELVRFTAHKNGDRGGLSCRTWNLGSNLLRLRIGRGR